MRAMNDVGSRTARVEEALATIGWARSAFGDELCVATSFNDTVLVDLAMAVDPDIPVFFADTGFHFAETLDTMRAAQIRYRLDLRVARPDPAATDRWAGGTTACCHQRKVGPLLQAMADQGFRAWLTGLRRVDSPTRANATAVSDGANGMTKVAPIIEWTDRDVDDYQRERFLITNPLVAQGYPSIGCWPCTQRSTGDDPRGGRWAGETKTECGLHQRSTASDGDTSATSDTPVDGNTPAGRPMPAGRVTPVLVGSGAASR